MMPLPIAGIIANPAASKDIRRLVAHGRVVPDWEKVNIIRRVMIGLESVGVRKVVAMPDPSRLCARARDDKVLSLEMEYLEMPVYGEAGDTIRAAAMMKDSGVGCLVTLGGDGTNRAVAKGCGDIPLLPISTGTNNVFPTMVEGTLAGMIAGVVARRLVDVDTVCVGSKRLEVFVDGDYRDMALVDVAVSGEHHVASKAIWDPATLREVFLSRAEPASLGLSSIGARLHPISIDEPAGLYFRPGDGGKPVLAPIAPGLVSRVPILEWRTLSLNERVQVLHDHCTIALDGEREFPVLPTQQVEVALTDKGPRVVMLDATLRAAAACDVFLS